MFKIPKARTMGFTLLLATTLLLSGCCTCRERYAPALEQMEENLRDDIRPKYEAALKASGRPDDLMKNDLGLVDDTADGLERLRTHGPDAWEPGRQQ